ncbi:MAG: hypothetical protein KBS55_01980 [Bacteroidales bacterium]|nr:hypothetical protein [Candidatus Cryptobacteroides aphodequi]
MLLIFCASLQSGRAEERHVIVLRAVQPDMPFGSGQEHWDSLLVEAGRYFSDQFAPAVSYVFDFGAEVLLSRTYDNTSVRQAVAEAVRLADEQVDFSLYDYDGDKVIDDVCVIFSGDAIWPQFDRLHRYVSADLKQVGPISVVSEYQNGEPVSLGTFCHEFAHSLGLPDLYDSDGEGSRGSAEALWGSISLMDQGNMNDGGCTPPSFGAVEYDCLDAAGFICPQAWTRDTLATGNYTLRPGEHHFLYAPTSIEGDYYLFECRAQSGWDKAVGGSGLLVYHIDRSIQDAGYSTLYGRDLTAAERWSLDTPQVNCNPSHQCTDLVEASGDAACVADVFFTEGSFTSDSSPAWRGWDGTQSGLALTGIRFDAADSSVSFNVIRPFELVSRIVLQSGCILQWQIDPSLLADADSCVVSWSRAGRSEGRKRLSLTDDGLCSAVIEGLEPSTDYLNPSIYKIDLQLVSGGVPFSTTTSVQMLIYDERNTFPYIYLNDVDRTADGSIRKDARIPLMVYNAPDAESVRWTFDGVEIGPDALGMYTVKVSGVLRAEVLWPDGSTDVIVKYISAQ